jgi:chromosome segregation ATPase
MPQDIKSLKRKIDAITSNIAIYKHDHDRYVAKLNKLFGITDLQQAEALLDELENKISKAQRRQTLLLSRANQLLKDVKVTNEQYLEANKRLLQKPDS